MLVVATAATALAFSKIVFKDPKGDDFGPGKHTYPTDRAFDARIFDLVSVTVEDAGSNVKFTVEFGGKITDSFDSKRWAPPGNGFSHQLVQIYVDTDHKSGSGHTDALAGTNVKFAADSAWDKAVLIAPQAYTQSVQEVRKRASAVAGDVVVPKKVQVKGRKLVAKVPKKNFGTPAAGWGWQVLVHSSDGLGGVLFSRKVNEFKGQWRFGGGNDYDCDPHVIDILAGPAQGGGGEKDAQKKALAYHCDEADPEGPKNRLATVPMIYR